MEENFLKFKKKVWLHILLKCISVGLTAGFLAVNAVLLPCRLYGIKLFWLYYVLIALGGFIVGGGITFLILRTDDKKIAQRLDGDFNLSERVQTSLAYSGKSGEMLEAQRADTSAVLAATLAAKSASSLALKNILATVLSGCISVVGVISVPVVATTVPPVLAEQEQEEPQDPPRPITDWEWAALDDLIDYVTASKKADSFTKTGIVKHLQGLKSVLLIGVSQSSLSGFVYNTVTEIRNTVKDANENGISDEQQALNSEEEAYVIAKLYEIFSLQQIGPSDPENPSENEDPENPSGNVGVRPGNLNVNDTPFFHPELGYVKCGEVRAEFYERAQQALIEGTISKEEWEYIIITYFGDLSGNED